MARTLELSCLRGIANLALGLQCLFSATCVGHPTPCPHILHRNLELSYLQGIANLVLGLQCPFSVTHMAGYLTLCPHSLYRTPITINTGEEIFSQVIMRDIPLNHCHTPSINNTGEVLLTQGMAGDALTNWEDCPPFYR